MLLPAWRQGEPAQTEVSGSVVPGPWRRQGGRRRMEQAGRQAGEICICQQSARPAGVCQVAEFPISLEARDGGGACLGRRVPSGMQV
ncbi:hypothetical protein CBF45_13385 [Bordetella sp. J329]|nr:hypothetical protein CBF45_13385 [Bordetella sp. J329]